VLSPSFVAGNLPTSFSRRVVSLSATFLDRFFNYGLISDSSGL
jgi:hypothetical protein